MTSEQGHRTPAPATVWPAAPTDLIDTSLCPWCFRRLAGPVCGVCDLDLTSPRASTVLELGRRIVDTEAARNALMVRMRAESAAIAMTGAPAVAPLQVAAGLEQSRAAAALSTQTQPQIRTQAPPAGPPVALSASALAYPPPTLVRSGTSGAPSGGQLPPDPSSRRRPSAQVVLLTTGVALVSVFAVFFAVLAYVVASVETRSVLTAAASLVVLAIAWVLRRRGLDGTAEGVGVIGVVLLLLDVWIVRVNRLFGADRLDLSMYTGLALLVVTVVLVGVSRLTSLRSPSVCAAVVGPIGLFAAVLGTTRSGAADADGTLVAAAVTGLAVLLDRLPRLPRAERVVLRVVSVIAGLLTLVAAVAAFPQLVAGQALGFALAALVWAVHLVVVVRPTRTGSVAPGRAWGVIGAVGLALATSGVAIGVVDAVAPAEAADGFQPAAVMLAATLLTAVARVVSGTLARPLRLSAAVAAGAGALLLLPGATRILVAVLDVLSARSFRAAPLATVGDVDPAIGWLVLGVAVTGAALSGGLVLARSPRVVSALAWAPLALATLAVAGCAVIAPSVLATVAVDILGAIVLLVAAAWRRAAAAARIAAFAGGMLTALAAAGFALASSGVWLLATIVVLAVLVSARVVALNSERAWSTGGAVTASGLAVAVALAAGGIAPSWAAGVSRSPDDSPGGFGAAIVGLVIIGALAFVAHRLPRAESATVGGITALAVAPAAVIVWATGDVVADVGWRLALVALAVGVATAWAVVGRAPSARSAGGASSIPLLALLAADASIVASNEPGALPGSLAAALLLVVLSALLVAVSARRSTRSAPTTSIVAEIAIAVTAAATLVLSLVDGGPLTRLTLLVIAAIPTLLAFRPGTAPSRRPVAWIGATLAVAALWWFLLDERVTDIEYYSLPVAGLLLLVAGVVGWRSRHSGPGAPPSRAQAASTGLDALTAVSLAVAILPSAFVASAGDAGRAIIVTAAGVVFLALALVVLRDGRVLHLRSITWSAGVVAVGLPAIVRAVVPDGGSSGALADGATAQYSWMGAVAFVLIGAALAITRVRRSPLLSDVAASGAAAALGVLVSRSLLGGSMTGAEASPWLIIVCGIAVSAFALDDDPREDASRSERTARRSSARVTAIVGLVAGLAISVNALASVEDVEWITVPVAVAALSAGYIRLLRDPRSGSWPTLASGLLMLLVPSLAYDLGESTLWRVTALGVVGVVITVVGALRRLQSPLVIGAVVTILHGLAQLWPWLSGLYEAGYWWVWAGVGGVLLIAFAARYEQRMQNLRAVGRALHALR
ncbi:hypothetical protein ELQ90_07440 [Labedella phragmitis]|uniref:Uncharacterized protein n=1 Tax=Labedella phragmitis TaxID=2498849 RepID=A0A444PVJ6_9MICO|nr:hypothetical protein [Labedella phragmitis]RWZ51906.1 hypothetical protein ELQ90_07440 [Labedella phragmitis]